MTAAYVGSRGMKAVTEDDLSRLDVINIAFGTVKDGVLFYGTPDDTAAEIRRMKGIKPEIKIVLSIGGWGAGGFSTMCRDAQSRAPFVSSVVEMTETLGLDGIDLDWEYPTIGSAGIDYAPEDKHNFTLLLAEIRAALDARYSEHKLLTIAAGAGEYYIEAVEIAEIVPLLDYISLMTYDMAGAWTCATHHTALYSGGTNPEWGDKIVKLFHEAGVPYEKLVLGAAFYSRYWSNIPAGDNHGLGMKCDDPNDKKSGFWGPGAGDILTKLINPDGTCNEGWELFRDEGAHARWMYREATRELLSFDDEESVTEKVRYARSMGLWGVMYWEHGNDGTRRLLKAISEA